MARRSRDETMDLTTPLDLTVDDALALDELSPEDAGERFKQFYSWMVESEESISLSARFKLVDDMAAFVLHRGDEIVDGFRVSRTDPEFKLFRSHAFPSTGTGDKKSG